MTLVVDASAMCELLLARPQAGRVAAVLAEHDYDLHAPHLIDTETLSVLRQLVVRGDADPERAEQAICDLHDLPIERYGHHLLTGRVWALRENFSACDATYVALAEALTEDGVPLLTCDGRLGRAVAAHTDLDVIVVA